MLFREQSLFILRSMWISTLHGQNAIFVNVKADDAYEYGTHCALQREAGYSFLFCVETICFYQHCFGTHLNSEIIHTGCRLNSEVSILPQTVGSPVVWEFRESIVWSQFCFAGHSTAWWSAAAGGGNYEPRSKILEKSCRKQTVR